MAHLADRVKETTITTGTGPITLAGAVTQFQAFATAWPAAKQPVIVTVAIVGQTGTEWEVCRGTFSGTTITRENVLASSNAGGLVTFSAGTKDVFVTASAEYIDNAGIGHQTVIGKGWALP
jgi:hypothetical protein